MEAQRVIERLGHKPVEAKTYLLLLQIGEGTAADIARAAGTPRTTARDVLDKLEKQGYARCYMKRRQKIWTAEPPRNILKRHEDVTKSFAAILPQLEQTRKTKVAQQYMQTALGAEGVDTILEDYLVVEDAPIVIANTAFVRHMSSLRSWKKLEKRATVLPEEVLALNKPEDEGRVSPQTGVLVSAQALSFITVHPDGSYVAFHTRSQEVSRIMRALCEHSLSAHH